MSISIGNCAGRRAGWGALFARHVHQPQGLRADQLHLGRDLGECEVVNVGGHCKQQRQGRGRCFESNAAPPHLQTQHQRPEVAHGYGGLAREADEVVFAHGRQLGVVPAGRVRMRGCG